MDWMQKESSGRSDVSSGNREQVRLDQLLVQRGLAQSRAKSAALIMAGEVKVDGTVVDKPGKQVPCSAHLVVSPRHSGFVSRGGVKLAAALHYFEVSVEGKVLLDIGASTGGFTDCLLQHGAEKIFAVDVGYGQLDWKIRQNPKVEVLERTNIRNLRPEDFLTLFHGAVIDVSFISLRLVMPPVGALLHSEAFIIALIKPQFEVGKGQVGKGGIVRDPQKHGEVVERLSAFSESEGWDVQGCIPSPILGQKGNREFLIYLTR
jgi:23S rRNA (cytidine1920-2'-O)/16S rRNA (cytidine1409-2'-O)-methyltransferase